MKKQTAIKTIKISLFSVLCALEAFFTYSVIGYMVVWLSQPRFVSADGAVTTASLGFLIQFIIFCIFFVLAAGGLAASAVWLFRKKKPKNAATKNIDGTSAPSDSAAT